MEKATIAALASGRPPAGIAVIRLSGPLAFAATAAFIRRPLPPPRRLSLQTLTNPLTSEILDRSLIAIFPGPTSASGEDLAEFHLHGGTAVISGVLDALAAMPGVRLAEPGEFTRRAFSNGCLDLAQVEGLADLVAAETTSQRNQALALAGGALSRAADAWRERCIGILAEAEAGLDFAEDESDVAIRLDEAAQEKLQAMATELGVLIDDAARGARLRDGLTIAVSGPPNVGKSSLVNVLSGRDAAIVTAIPGTTRDPIEVPLDLGGIAVTIIDTAGLRETDDPIEAEGIRRARARAAAADLVVFVVDAESSWPIATGRLLVINKVDIAVPASPPVGAILVSATRGDGIASLRNWLTNWAMQIVRPGEPALLSHVRHRIAFADAAAALIQAAGTDDMVLRAESLRIAGRAFARIAGRIDVDDVLDRIFSRFCIGK
jgi:tRNA modification GTPase